MPLVDYLSSDSTLRVLCILMSLGGRRGVRETGDLCDLSPRGASLILERLVRFGLAVRRGSGRELKYEAHLSPDDEKTLRSLFEAHEVTALKETASHYSTKSVEWIDPTVRDLKRITRKSRGTAQDS